jgi:Ca2+-transporting ATPase
MTSKYKFKGLTSAEAEKSKKEHGTNELPPPEIATFWDSLLENFEDPLIRILMVALAIICAIYF